MAWWYRAFLIVVFISFISCDSMEDRKKTAGRWPLVSSSTPLDRHILTTAKGGSFHRGCTQEECLHEAALYSDIRRRNTTMSDAVIIDCIKTMCHWDRVYCWSAPCMDQRLSHIIQSIIKARGNVETSDAISGYTPLHAAVRWFQRRYSPYDIMPDACMQALLQQGARINARDTVGRTPLMTTLVSTRVSEPCAWVEYLLDNSADPNTVVQADAVPHCFGGEDLFNRVGEKRKLVPFFIATLRALRLESFRYVVQTLLDANADVAWSDESGRPIIERIANDYLVRDSEAGTIVREEYKKKLAALLPAWPTPVSETVMSYVIGDTEKQVVQKPRSLGYDINNKPALPALTFKRNASG